jgi:hypothetical protein
MVVGAPSYTSGVQKWNGTADILYPKPAKTMINAMSIAVCDSEPMEAKDCCIWK